MAEYHISTLIVNGVAFKSEQPLNLNGAVKLARKFEKQGYVFYIDEKISENHYEIRSLSELEKLLEKQ